MATSRFHVVPRLGIIPEPEMTEEDRQQWEQARIQRDEELAQILAAAERLPPIAVNLWATTDDDT